MTVYIDGHEFVVDCSMIDVTSNHRPATGWQHVDALGHLHQWYADGKPATTYSPQLRYSTPTLKWVVDGIDYYPDGEPLEFGHHECVICGAHVTPVYTADEYTQYLPGLKRCYIDGEPVSHEEFERRLQAHIHKRTE